MLAWHAWNLGYHPLYLEEALNSGTENVEAGGSETQVILNYIPSLKLAWVTRDSIFLKKKVKKFYYFQITASYGKLLTYI